MTKKTFIIDTVFVSALAAVIIVSAGVIGASYQFMLFNIGSSAPAWTAFIMYAVFFVAGGLIAVVWAIVKHATKSKQSAQADEVNYRKISLVINIVPAVIIAVLMIACAWQVAYSFGTLTALQNAAVYAQPTYMAFGLLIPYSVAILAIGIMWAVVYRKTGSGRFNSSRLEQPENYDRDDNVNVSDDTAVTIA